MSGPIQIDAGLTLRPLTVDDAGAFYRVVEANREAIGAFMLWARTLDSVARVRSIMAEWERTTLEVGTLKLGVFLDGELVGSVYHLRACRTHGHVEVGYWLAASAQGRGVATRSVKALLDATFGELGFRRAYLRIAPQNAASVALAERVGLEREGVLRDLWQTEPGVWWDGVVYATTADRWAEAKRPDGGEGDGVFAARRHALADGQVLTIRRPVEADAGALLTYLDGMRRESWGVLSSPEDELFTLAEERAWVRSAREAPDGLQLAAFTQDGEVVAMVGMSTDRRHVRRRHAGVLGLSVRRSHWRRGLGRLLMREVVAYAERRPGLAVLELDVDTFNAPAIALYESLGFERDGVRRNFVRYADGSYGDAMVMSKWVGEGARPTGRDHDPLLGESSA